MFVLIDAVDEMNSISRKTLLNVLRSTHENLHLLVTSRNILQIEVDLYAHEKIEIHAAHSDLEAFTLAKLNQQSTGNLRRLVSGSTAVESPFETIAEEIASEVVARAGNMYVCFHTYDNSLFKHSYFIDSSSHHCT